MQQLGDAVELRGIEHPPAINNRDPPPRLLPQHRGDAAEVRPWHHHDDHIGGVEAVGERGSARDRRGEDGRRALELATIVHTAAPTPVHAETVALALAELERCDDAAEWMRRAIADADRVKDTVESLRLRSEADRYGRRPCRR